MNTMEVYNRVAKRWTLHHARINHRRGFFGMGIIKGTVADESAAVVHKPGWECDTASLFSRIAHAKTVCRSTDPHWQQYGIPGGCSAQCATAFRAVAQGEGCEAAVQNLVRIPRLPSRLQLLTGDPCVLRCDRWMANFKTLMTPITWTRCSSTGWRTTARNSAAAGM